MKHILNDLTEEEKNSIREQHVGGMRVMTENFSKLVNSKLGDSKPLVSEQNRQLLKRRFIRITNLSGETLLFDVTEVTTNSKGCTFTGDFRGEYDSVLNFLDMPDVKIPFLSTKRPEGERYNFLFDCSRPAYIVLNGVGKNQNFTIDTAGQQVLSKVCKCSRYK